MYVFSGWLVRSLVRIVKVSLRETGKPLWLESILPRVIWWHLRAPRPQPHVKKSPPVPNTRCPRLRLPKRLLALQNRKRRLPLPLPQSSHRAPKLRVSLIRIGWSAGTPLAPPMKTGSAPSANSVLRLKLELSNLFVFSQNCQQPPLNPYVARGH